jgi:hypothetical protein
MAESTGFREEDIQFEDEAQPEAKPAGGFTSKLAKAATSVFAAPKKAAGFSPDEIEFEDEKKPTGLMYQEPATPAVFGTNQDWAQAEQREEARSKLASFGPMRPSGVSTLSDIEYRNEKERLDQERAQQEAAQSLSWIGPSANLAKAVFEVEKQEAEHKARKEAREELQRVQQETEEQEQRNRNLEGVSEVAGPGGARMVRVPKEIRRSDEFPNPLTLVERGLGAASGALRGLLGDTKLVRSFEEGSLLPPDPDAPRPIVPKSALEDPLGLIAKKEAEQWDRMQSNKDAKEAARQVWKPLKELREKQGRIASPDALPNIVDLKGSMFDKAIDDPTGPFAAFGKAYVEAMSAGVPMSAGVMGPDLSGMPVSIPTEGFEGNVLPERFQETFSDVEKERKKHRVRGFGNIASNVARDFGDIVSSVAEIGNELVGVVKLEPGETVAEHAQKTGYALGMAPAQAGALLLGLGDLNGTNSMLTHPFSTWMMTVDPALKVASKVGLGKVAVAVNKKIDALATPLIVKAVNKLVPEAVIKGASAFGDDVGEFRASLIRYMRDGLHQRDPRIAAILDALVNDPAKASDKMRAIAEQMARQVEKGLVKPVSAEVERVDLTATPAEDSLARAKAEREAAAARKEYEVKAGQKEQAKQVAQKLTELSREIRDLKRQATKTQSDIAKATTDAERAEFKKKLADLKNQQRVAESRLSAEARESRFRSRAASVSEEAGEAGVELAEGVEGTQSQEKEARATDRQIMRKMAEAERLLSAADEARQRGISQEDVLRERAEKIRKNIEARQQAQAAKAAVSGVKLAEQAKGVSAEDAVAMAREAAANQAASVTGAGRRAATLEARAPRAGELPEVNVGPIYVSPERTVSGRVSEAMLRERVEKAPTVEAKAVAEAQLQEYLAAREGSKVNQAELRKDVDRLAADHDRLNDVAKKNSKAALDDARKLTEDERALKEAVDQAATPEEKAAAQAALDERIAQSEQLASTWRQSMEDAGKRLEETLEANRKYRRTLSPEVSGVTREIRTIDPRATQYLDRLVEEAREQLLEAEDALKGAEVFGPAPEAVRQRLQNLVDADKERVSKVEKAIADERQGAYRVLEGGQPQTMAQAFPEVPKHRRLMIEELQAEASEAKKKALEAGFNPDMEIQISSDLARNLELPQKTTIYEFARRYTEYANNLNVDNLPQVVAQMLRQKGVRRGFAEAANWLDAEVQAWKASQYMVEPEYGMVQRPAPVETTYRISPEGKRIEMPQAAERRYQRSVEMTPEEVEDMADAILATGEIPKERFRPGTEEVVELVRQTDEALAQKLETQYQNQAAIQASSPYAERATRLEEEMASRKIGREPPVPSQTQNPIFQRGLGEMHQTMAGTVYEQPALREGAQVSTAPIPKDLSVPQQFVSLVDMPEAKALTPERFAMRMVQNLIEDTTQLLRDKRYKTELLKRFRGKAEAAGLTGDLLDAAIKDFNKLLEDPKALSSSGKNRFITYETPDGKTIWTREDFANTTAEWEPSLRQKAQANAFRDAAGHHADAVQSYGLVQGVVNENSRIYRNPDGTMKTKLDINGKEVNKIQNDMDYAKELENVVLDQGEVRPIFMPYNPYKLGYNLEKIAESSPEKAVELNKLADQLRNRMVKVDEYRGGALQTAFDNYFRKVFEKTEQPPDLNNLYVDRSVADSLIAHLTMLNDGSSANTMFKVFHELSKFAKKNVVAMNLRALVNNDLSNLLNQSFRRADPSMFFNIVHEPIKFKYFMDGDYAKLTPEEVRMFRSINETGMVNSGEVSKDIGQTKFWKTVSEALGKKGEKITDINAVARSKGRDLAKPFEAYGSMMDAMAENYQKLGDVPFRIEEAVHKWKAADERVRMLKNGEHIVIPISDYRKVMLTEVDGRVRVTEISGPRAKLLEGQAVPSRTYGLDSPELARIYAEYANYAQEKVFFDYGKIGNWGKYLRSSAFAPLSGIFSWFFKALDIPGIKPGLAYEMFNGTPVFETTSKAIQSMQSAESLQLSARRATLAATAAAAFRSQRKLEDVRRAGSFSPTVNGVILAAGSDPSYAYARSVEPLLFLQPTAGLFNGIQALSSSLEFGVFKNDTQTYINILKTNPEAYEKYTTKQWEALKKQDPETYANAQDLMRTKQEDPDYYENQKALRRDFLNWSSGKQLNKEQLAQMFGVSGGPLIKWWENVINNKGSNRGPQMMNDFAKIFFGATPTAIADIGLSAIDSDYSTYGYAKRHQGFALAGGTEENDVTKQTEWAIRQLLGIGWNQVAFQNVEDLDGYHEIKGRLEKHVADAAAKMKQSLVKENNKALITLRDPNSSDQEKLEARKALEAVEQLKDLIANVKEESLNNLNRDYKALQENIKKYPGPKQKP